MIDTHAHLDGQEFAEDRDAVMARAKQVGVEKVFIPAIDLPSVQTVQDTCRRYPGQAFPMIGLHPEEVRSDWQAVLQQMKQLLDENLRQAPSTERFIGIGEIGLDYYWSREYEHEQLEAFEQQVAWSIETRLPLMIHCRKAQNEMVKLLRPYASELPGGVFHCFTGNEHEAEELLSFPRFVLGIGGVLTFKKSKLPDTLRHCVPLDRIVLETDAPYMAPVPHRGQRNESAFVVEVARMLADIYQQPVENFDRITTTTAERLFLPSVASGE